MRRDLIALTFLMATGVVTFRIAAQQQPAPAAAATPTPQGTHTENGLAGFAKILCSAVFVSGRDADEAAKNSAYFFMPAPEQDKVKYTVDRYYKSVKASFGETTREARYYSDQGCIIQIPNKPGISFTRIPVSTTLPDAMTQPWPMGDQPDKTPFPAAVNRAKIDAAVDAAFADPTALT
ncbi:MAG TPA: hypothetical protein VH679_06845, partial [Vicinamibacterales bacterium]